MSDPSFATDQHARVQPADIDLDFADGDLSDLDQHVLEGMARLRALQAQESQIADLRPAGDHSASS